MKEKQKQRLRVFEMVCLRKIEEVTRRALYKKRRNIQQTKYQNWNNRHNTEQTATIL